MTSPWNSNEPARGRRATSRPGSWTPAPFPKAPTKAEREQFVTRLLATLPAPDAEPISTTQLGDHFQLDQYLRNNLLWTNLARLASEGLVQRVVKEGERVRYWRRTPAGE